MINLDSILKSRDITLPTNVCLVKAMVFPVVMYGCESWTIKKAEHWIIDAFELWYWRRPLRVPWIATRSNKSILKEISPGCLLEGLMLKLSWKKRNTMKYYTPVSLPGESHGRRSTVHGVADMTERLHFTSCSPLEGLPLGEHVRFVRTISLSFQEVITEVWILFTADQETRVLEWCAIAFSGFSSRRCQFS